MKKERRTEKFTLNRAPESNLVHYVFFFLSDPVGRRSAEETLARLFPFSGRQLAAHGGQIGPSRYFAAIHRAAGSAHVRITILIDHPEENC